MRFLLAKEEGLKEIEWRLWGWQWWWEFEWFWWWRGDEYCGRVRVVWVSRVFEEEIRQSRVYEEERDESLVCWWWWMKRDGVEFIRWWMRWQGRVGRWSRVGEVKIGLHGDRVKRWGVKRFHVSWSAAWRTWASGVCPTVSSWLSSVLSV